MPLVDYDDIEHYILNIKEHNTNELCADSVVAFSMSSGTTSKSKYIPITLDFLNNYYKGGRDNLSYYLKAFPNSTILCGSNFSLLGTVKKENDYITGDVSAVLYEFVSKIFTVLKMNNLDYHRISSWDDKLREVVPKLKEWDVRWVSGVPSWILKVIKEVDKHCQDTIASQWSNFEVFFYGGTSVKPFEDMFRSFLPKSIFWQIYNASEGIFSVQDVEDHDDMLLLVNSEIYYEFVEIGKSTLEVIDVEKLELNKRYEIIITNNSGLYRYRIGDIVKVTCLNPIRIKVIGRTKFYINTFGEETYAS